MFDIRLAHRADDIGQTAWDALSGCRPFSSYRWYCFGEAALAGDLPVYIMLSRDGAPVARATFWLTRQERLPIEPGLLRALAQTAFRRWPLFMCRSPLSSSSGLILPSDAGLRRAAFEAINRAALDFARRAGASFLLFDYVEPDLEPLAEFSTYHFSEVGTALAITSASFDEYLAGLGKSARKDYHRHSNRAADLGIVVRTAARITDDVEAALALIHNVERKYGTPHTPVTRRTLENAHRADHVWLSAEINGQMVGCGLLLKDGDACILALLGLDDRVNYVYFQLFYAAVRAAIEAGARILRGGTGAYEFKQRLGFQMESSNRVMFAASSPLVRSVMRPLVAG